MRINELLSEQQDIDEGISDFVGRAAGHAVGAAGKAGRGITGAWQDAKAGYKAAKGSWDPETDPDAAKVDPTLDAGGTSPTASSDRPFVAPAGARTAPGAAATAPSPTGPDPKQLRQQAAELTQQADEIEQTASSQASAAPKPGGGAFGQMASQLGAKAPPEASSTGGTTQQTATGQVHTASPTNPNQAPAGELSAAEKAANSAAGKAAAPYGFNSQTGKPNPPPEQAAPGAPAAEPVVPAATPTTAAPTPPAPQFKGPNVKGLQVRNMGEGKKLKFRSNFLGIDL